MAGYTFAVAHSTPSSSQGKRYTLSHQSNRRTPGNQSLGMSRKSLNAKHRPYSPRFPSASKVIKSKNRNLKSGNMHIRSEERQLYFTKYFEPSFSANTSRPYVSPLEDGFNGLQPPSSLSAYRKMVSQSSASMPQAAAAYPRLSHLSGQSSSSIRTHYRLIDEIKCRGLTAASPSKLIRNSPVNVHKLISHQQSGNHHNAKSHQKSPPCTTGSSSGKLSRIQQWNMPAKSIEFKSTVEPKFGLIFEPTQEEATTRRLSNTLQDTQLVEKMNTLQAHQSHRARICLAIRSFFRSAVTPFLTNKLRQFIPFKQQDYEVSADAHVERIEPVLPVWTEQMEKELSQILQSPNRLLVTAFSINVHTSDIRTLCDRTWLNDAVIEFYFNLITKRSQENTKYPSIYTFGTYFFPRLEEGKPIGRWARKLDFFSYRLLIIPIIKASHWRLVIVDNDAQKIEYYDSLGLEFPNGVDMIANFLQADYREKRKEELNLANWQIAYSVPGIPQQKNSFDCGVFACKYAEYISRQAAITFTQDHIPLFRKCMMYEIIHQKLLVD